MLVPHCLTWYPVSRPRNWLPSPGLTQHHPLAVRVDAQNVAERRLRVKSAIDRSASAAIRRTDVRIGSSTDVELGVPPGSDPRDDEGQQPVASGLFSPERDQRLGPRTTRPFQARP